jgi:hypothetical protein
VAQLALTGFVFPLNPHFRPQNAEIGLVSRGDIRFSLNLQSRVRNPTSRAFRRLPNRLCLGSFSPPILVFGLETAQIGFVFSKR